MFRSKNRVTSVITIVLLILALALTGCSNPPAAAPDANKPADKPAEKKVLKVGASAIPHAEILEFVKPKLAEKGIDLQIMVFNDYVQPNLATDKGDVDANFFQHIPYLETFNAERNLNLVHIAKVHIEPMGIYSKKFKDLAEFDKGGRVAIPVDPSNAGRALNLLQASGLIKLKDGVGIKGTVQDIIENPKELSIVPIDAAQLPRFLDDPKTTGAVINTNYALEGGLNPLQDALFIESKETTPYLNVLVVKKEREQDLLLQQLAQELNTEAVRTFIDEEYKGAVVTAF